MRTRKSQPFESTDDSACRICGRVTALTFEHLPPESSGNRGRAEMLGLEDWLRAERTGEPERGLVQQRGSGAYTLCESCNNRAGRIYVPEFNSWCERGSVGLSRLAPRLEDFDASEEAAYAKMKLKRIRPARFLKQVTTMLLALATPGFPPQHLDLQAFAQDPEWVGLPEAYQFYIALYSSDKARYNGGAALLGRGLNGEAGTTFTLELAHPPFAYVLSVDEHAPAIECGNITEFAELGIHQRADLEIQLRIGFGHTPFPLDFRSRAIVDRDARRSGSDNASGPEIDGLA